MKNKIKMRLKNNKFLFLIAQSIWHFYYYIVVLKLFALLLRLFPIKSNKIVVCSYYGKRYGDNPKAIIESLKQIAFNQKMSLDIVWMLNKENYNNNNLPVGI